jgi:putative nucleotidyltransferase with HDIG domain
MEAKEAAQLVAATLRHAGRQAFFAGGCVRDTLLKVEPKDYDIATDAKPEEVIRLFPGALTVGAHFGVVVVRVDGVQIEVATFRRDGSYSDGRRPDTVEFSSAAEDAKRRDFTVNGLFADPATGEIVDYVGGRADLEARVLRAIGDPGERFQEDRLRLLRAVRFATVLDFDIEKKTWAAVCAMSGEITGVSMERVRDELAKILVHANRVRGFDLLVESGLMAAVLPEILVLQGCEQPPQFHPEGDVFVHTRLMLSHLPSDASLAVVLAVLFHDIAKPATQTVDADGRIRFNGHAELGAEKTDAILRRLKFPNEIVESVVESVANHMTFMDVTKMRVSRLRRFMARPNFNNELQLHRVDCLGCHGMLDNYEYLLEKQAEFANEPLIPERLVTGADLIALGWQAGPELGALLTEIQTQQLEGKLTDRAEALSWLEERLPAS